MNTGVGDAVDLAWKLDAVLRGWGGGELLTSYEAERRPIAVRNVEEATRNFRRRDTYVIGPNITEDTTMGADQREAFTEALQANNVRRQYEGEGMALGYRYEHSPVICPDGTSEPPDDSIEYLPTARPGHLAPHAWTKPGISTLDLFGKQFVLLRFGAAPPDAGPLQSAADACGMPLLVHDIAKEETERLYDGKLVLVRPDGHVAWRANKAGEDAAAIINRVRGVAG